MNTYIVNFAFKGNGTDFMVVVADSNDEAVDIVVKESDLNWFDVIGQPVIQVNTNKKGVVRTAIQPCYSRSCPAYVFHQQEKINHTPFSGIEEYLDNRRAIT